MSQAPAHLSVSQTALASHQTQVERCFARNTVAFVLWEFLWGLGGPFVMVGVIVTAYLDSLGAPKMVIGFVLALQVFFSAMAIVANYFVPARNRMAIYRVAMVIGLIPWLLYGITSVLWGTAWPNVIHYALMILSLMFFFGTASGFGTLYYEILTDNTPLRWRGQGFGWRAVGGSTAGLVMSYAAYSVLARWETPLNFRICFVIGVSIFLASCVTIWFIRDNVHPSHQDRSEAQQRSFWRYLSALCRQALMNRQYRTFLCFVMLLYVAASGAPFMIAAARAQLGVGARQQGLFTAASLAIGATLGWAIGRISDRFGHRLLGIFCGCLISGSYLMVLLSHTIGLWYVAYGAFALSGLCISILLCNMGAELLPGFPTRNLMAIGNLMMVCFVMPCMTFAGLLVDQTHSYTPIFIISGLLGICGAAGFAFVVRDPRAADLPTLRPLKKAA